MRRMTTNPWWSGRWPQHLSIRIWGAALNLLFRYSWFQRGSAYTTTAATTTITPAAAAATAAATATATATQLGAQNQDSFGLLGPSAILVVEMNSLGLRFVLSLFRCGSLSK